MQMKYAVLLVLSALIGCATTRAVESAQTPPDCMASLKTLLKPGTIVINQDFEDGGAILCSKSNCYLLATVAYYEQYYSERLAKDKANFLGTCQRTWDDNKVETYEIWAVPVPNSTGT